MMINPFGDLAKLQQQAQQMQQSLQNERVVVEKNGVKITIRGDQVIEEIVIDGISEPRLVDAINESVKKTQELAARKLIEISTQQK